MHGRGSASIHWTLRHNASVALDGAELRPASVRKDAAGLAGGGHENKRKTAVFHLFRKHFDLLFLCHIMIAAPHAIVESDYLDRLGEDDSPSS